MVVIQFTLKLYSSYYKEWLFYFFVIISNRLFSLLIIFLYVSLSFLNSKVIVSYEQTNLIPDKSSIMKTTDCISSMITSVFMRFNNDCSNNISDTINNNSNNTVNTKNIDPFSFGIDNKNSNTSSAITEINDDGLIKNDSLLSLDNPSSFTKSLQLDQNLSLVNSSSSLQSISSKTKSDNSLNNIDELKNILDKNKHGKEIFECFSRAIAFLNSLPDSAIIKCTKSHNSFIALTN